jgi:hypothetical protein
VTSPIAKHTAHFLFEGLVRKTTSRVRNISVVGFAWANFRVFRKNEGISALEAVLASYQERISQPVITPDNGSRYTLVPAGNQAHADQWCLFGVSLDGGKCGSRNSTVNNYQVEIVELQETFPHVQPQATRTAQREFRRL